MQKNTVGFIGDKQLCHILCLYFDCYYNGY